MNPHSITKAFEEKVAIYTGAPYAVAVDNCSNALFLALTWWKNNHPHGAKIFIPANTYPAVPCEIIRAGFDVGFYHPHIDGIMTGPYQLFNTPVWDCALRFTSNMYVPGQLQCLSFTGPKKHLKLGKGGMILTDSERAYKWFKRARFSGRHECSYFDDNFDDEPVLGWNFYMPVETAARGLHLMSDFPRRNEDLTLPYPDLSKYELWQRRP